MCIIVLKLPGGHVTDDQLRTCYANNPDGAGLMYADLAEKKVIIRKGYFDVDKFIDMWHGVEKKLKNSATPVVLHFRISTGGKLDKNNCHPHRIAEDLAFVHNGILWSAGAKSLTSDTVQFRDAFLMDMHASDLTRRTGMMALMEYAIGGSNKMVFLNGRGKYDILNERSGYWSEDKLCWYSNSSYKPKVCPTCGGKMGKYYAETYGICHKCAFEQHRSDGLFNYIRHDNKLDDDVGPGVKPRCKRCGYELKLEDEIECGYCLSCWTYTNLIADEGKA